MLCQLCKQNPATIKISHVIHNKTIEVSLCKDCAEEKGVENPLVALPQIFGNFIAELFGKELFAGKNTTDDKECGGCGLTWGDFQEKGLFGCDNCYQTFQSELDLIIKKIHGSTKHIGNRPKSLRRKLDKEELKRMQIELKEAILNENFELAAELRDMIRDAQRECNKIEDDQILR